MKLDIKNFFKDINQEKNKKVNLTSRFAITLLSFIFAIGALIALFGYLFYTQLISGVEQQSRYINEAISSPLSIEVAYLLKEKKYQKISEIALDLYNKNEILLFIAAEDKKTKKLLYSSYKSNGDNFEDSFEKLKKYDASFQNKSFLWQVKFFIKSIIYDYKLLFTKNAQNSGPVEERVRNIDALSNIIIIQDKTLIERREIDNFIIYLGFSKDSYTAFLLNQYATKVPLIAIFAVFLALLVSKGLVEMITLPLKDLVKGTKEYAQGNLSNKIQNSKYVEIDELINAFNLMADNLNSLYQSLEQKVQERTFELDNALKELKSTQAMMVHSEKMKSLGELVAGITHEINNPVNFIYGNLVHLKNYSNDLISIIDKFIELEEFLPDDKKKMIDNLKDDVDYDFLKEDLPMLIKSCSEGTERTKNIVMDLKNFSRLDEKVLSEIDLAKEIDTTLNILHNKLKNRIEIHKEYEPDFPKIVAHGGQLNQVFMNIFDNAAFAIKDKGDIYIRLKKNLDNGVIIEIEDNGCGMKQEVIDKVFNPFFTTKEVGQGTGLGMSISYKVIKNHNGNISIKSEEGKGTKFIIELPLDCNNGKQK